MRNTLVRYWNVPALQAMQQEAEPTGKGIIVGQCQIARAGTMHPGVTLLLPDGRLHDVMTGQVQVVDVEDCFDEPEKPAAEPEKPAAEPEKPAAAKPSAGSKK